MKLRLKNVEREFEVSAPTERTANGASEKFWVLAFSVGECLTTEEVEEYFIPENMSEIKFVTELINGTEYEYTLTGYTKRLSSYIKHTDAGKCSVELQFSKSAGENTEAESV